MRRRPPEAQGRASQSRRDIDTVEPRRRFLIICEGENTEPDYFRAFRTPGLIVTVDGTGKNTLTLVDQAIETRDRLSSKCQYDECWCVFDRDSFPKDHFNNAVFKAEANGFEVGYSVQSFELWYLLHFDYCDSALHRSSYGDRLTDKLEQKYVKSANMSKQMYVLLHPHIHKAIENATRLCANYTSETPEKRDPCTTVHILVERLIQNAAP